MKWIEIEVNGLRKALRETDNAIVELILVDGVFRPADCPEAQPGLDYNDSGPSTLF